MSKCPYKVSEIIGRLSESVDLFLATSILHIFKFFLDSVQ